MSNPSFFFPISNPVGLGLFVCVCVCVCVCVFFAFQPSLFFFSSNYVVGVR